jgi:UDP-glucuronate 4-epimerase
MKILVTGSSGFIGYHLSKSLLDEGHTVYGLDEENEYYDVKLKHYRRGILNKYDNFDFLLYSIEEDFGPALTNKMWGEIDVVVNLAAQAGVRYSIENPHVYQKSNIEGFLNVLEYCRHNKTKLVYASSSSVYGGLECPEGGFHEGMECNTPISLYAASKKSNELMAHTYSHLYDIETIGLRFFTVYGPMGRPDMMMWLFSEAIKNNQPINLFNEGNMLRDFTYIDDIVAGIKACVFTKLPNKYEVFNLGNNRCGKLLDVVDIIEDSFGKKAMKNLMPMQAGDVSKTHANIDKTKKILGYEPKTTVDVGVKNFIEWYKEYSK